MTKKKIHPAISAHFRKLGKKRWDKFKAEVLAKAEKDKQNKG